MVARRSAAARGLAESAAVEVPATPLEIVRATYAAFARGEFRSVLDYLSEEVEWTFRGARSLPYTGVFHGRSEIARWFDAVAEVDDIHRFELRELIGCGDRVVAMGSLRARALPGGREFQTEWVHVLTVRGGRLVRFWGMYDTQASAAARL